MSDRLGAFCPDVEIRIPGSGKGPLAGLSFAAKDLYDIEGHVTGCGNPDWRRTHAPAARTAPVVQSLLDAGAGLVGKTITDELAFSLNGQNFHYGTPRNPNAPGRIPGGSSSGSASAVAGERVDFALGTDTGGSIRVPGGLCGIFGLRPTHGAVPIAGVMPLAPGFDTVGWFTRDAELLARVGDVLLPQDATPLPESSLAVIDDVLELADPAVASLCRDAVARIAPAFARSRSVRIAPLGAPHTEGLEGWMDRFRTLQGREIWSVHGPWVKETRPRFGPDVAERFAWSSTITEEAAAAATPFRETVIRALDGLLTDGTVLCLPTTPCVAPRLDAVGEDVASYRTRVLILTCISGLTGTPQVTLPAGRVPPEGGGDLCPAGLSLIARRGADRALLELARRVAPLLESS